MEIGPLSKEPRLTADKGDAKIGTRETGTAGTTASSNQDSVRISDHGRAKLAAVTADAYKQFGPTIQRDDTRRSNEDIDAPRPLGKNMSATDRIEILRERIEQGFYDRPDVIDEIARRLTENGTTPPKEQKDQGQTD